MPAYWCSRVHVTDPERYAKYVALSGPAIKEYGGVMLARGGAQIIFEGGDFERTVVIEFPSLAAAEACYHSSEYAEARQFTEGASERHVVAVEGVG
jgi:uncharacterized protein (DUF1330 family)